MKKKLVVALTTAGIFLSRAAFLAAQDTTPRGPAEWTGRNWLGFSLQIILFILAVIGIYKLADPGAEVEEETDGEQSEPSSD